MAPDVERRTWDKEAYEARAKARSANASSSSDPSLPSGTTTTGAAVAGEKRQLPSALQEEEDGSNKEEFQPAEKGRAGPAKSQRAFLKARRNKVDLESKLGTTEIISPEAAANTGGGGCIAVEGVEGGAVSIKDGITKSSTGVGWHCKVCDCFLKDSLTYLDHINGRKHQRYLGYSMRVEKSTTSEVSNKLAMLAKKKREEEQQRGISKGKAGKQSRGGGADDALAGEEENEFEAMVRRKDEEALRKKAERARRKEERKKKEQQEAQEEQEEGGIDPEMAAMMGFSGFGGGGANR